MSSEVWPTTLDGETVYFQEPADLEDIDNYAQERLPDGTMNTRYFGGHYLVINTGYTLITKPQFEELQAFAHRHKMGYESFLLTLPWKLTARGSTPGSPTVPNGETGSSVSTSGWTPSQSGILKRGDIIKFPSDDKVYTVTNASDVDSDVSGNATVQIYPELRATTTAGAITTSGVQYRVFLTGFGPPVKIAPGLFYSLKVSFQEANA